MLQGHLSYMNPGKLLSTKLQPYGTFAESCRRRQQIIHRASAVVIDGKCPAARTKEVVEVFVKFLVFSSN